MNSCMSHVADADPWRHIDASHTRRLHTPHAPSWRPEDSGQVPGRVDVGGGCPPVSRIPGWDRLNIARFDAHDRRIYRWRSARVLGRLIESDVKPAIDGLSGSAFAWFAVVAVVWRRPSARRATARPLHKGVSQDEETDLPDCRASGSSHHRLRVNSRAADGPGNGCTRSRSGDYTDYRDPQRHGHAVRKVLDAGCVSASGSRRSNVGLDPT